MKRLVAGLAIASAHAAHGEPTIELARCRAFDTAALRRAIDRAVSPAARTSTFAVVVDCPDVVTAHVHVEPASTDGPIARSLDLGEIAGDLRIKLLALAIAEVVEVAAAAPPARDTVVDAPPTKRTYRDPRDPLPLADVEPRERPASTHAAPVPSRGEPVRNPARNAGSRSEPGDDTRIAAARDGDPTEGSATTSAPKAGATHVKRVALAESIRVDAEGTAARSWTLEPRVALRSFASTSTILAGGGTELGLPWLRLGVHVAIGEVGSPLGTMRPWLVTASIAREVACAGRATQLCGLARVEAGVAGVSATATATVGARSALAHYAQAGVAAELAHHFTHWSTVADFEVAWADGLIARAGGHEAVALAGVTMIGALGVRWR